MHACALAPVSTKLSNGQRYLATSSSEGCGMTDGFNILVAAWSLVAPEHFMISTNKASGHPQAITFDVTSRSGAAACSLLRASGQNLYRLVSAALPVTLENATVIDRR
jgi:hypothetical protein